jgi:hypothetical protein
VPKLLAARVLVDNPDWWEVVLVLGAGVAVGLGLHAADVLRRWGKQYTIPVNGLSALGKDVDDVFAEAQ